MGSLQKETFVCIDCESTGLDPEKDRIVEVAVVLFNMRESLSSFETLVDPECPIPPISQGIHKISSEMLVGKPKIREILPHILSMIDKHVIVGHAIGFDVSLIANEAKRAGIPTKIEQQLMLDTLRLARLYGGSPVNSLEQLRKHFNIPAEGAHRAMSDVIVNIEVFKHLVRRFHTTEEALQILQKPIQLKTMPLGQHKGRSFDEIPIEYLRWAERKDFDQDLLYSIRLELKRRKRGGGFEQVSNPFTDL